MIRFFPTACCLLAFLLPGAASAQQTVPGSMDSEQTVLEDVRAALSSGDTESLMSRTDERVDVTIFGTSELLSRSQARYVIRSFFAQYPPSRAEILETTQADDNWFASGRYATEVEPEPLSFYLLLRHGAVGWELRELRFDRDGP